MRLVALVAAYQERPGELQACLAPLRGFDRTVVLASPDDGRPAFFPAQDWHIGDYTHEREKRDALLQLGKQTGADWLLCIDPDEELHNLTRLRLLLAVWPSDRYAYPLLRQEPSGQLWAMPCKCFRACAEEYTSLDVGLRFNGESWNLDPYQLGTATVIPGWPLLTHFPSARAARFDDGWYKDPQAVTHDREFPHYHEGYVPSYSPAYDYRDDDEW